MSKIIKWSFFKRVFWNNPALLWVGANLEKVLNENFEYQWHKQRVITEEENELFGDDNDEEIPDFDFGEMLELENSNQTTSINNIDLIAVQNFRKLKEGAIDFYAKKYNIQASEIFYIPTNLEVTQKVNLTKDLISNNSIRLIVDAHFGYLHQGISEKFLYVSDCFLYDKELAKMSLLGYSAKSPIENFYKFFYLVNVAKKENLIKDASLIIIDPVVNLLRNTKVKEIKFSESFSGHVAKSLPAKNSKLSFANNFYRQVLARTGDSSLFLNTLNYDLSSFSFYKVAINKELLLPTFKTDLLDDLPEDLHNYHQNKLKDNFKVLFTAKDNTKSITFKPINWYFSLIDRAYEKFGENVDYKAISFFATLDFSNEENIRILDYFVSDTLEIAHAQKQEIFFPNYLMSNEEKLAILTYVYGIEQWNISKTFFGALKLKYTKYEDIQKAAQLSCNLVNFFNVGVLNVIKSLHVKNKRVIWYDYEGFSDLFPILDTSKSYEQIVSQVSIIETINGEQTNINNYVVDTKNVSLKDLVKLIQIIYSNHADLFVVYNKTYENTRNSEIYNLVQTQIQNNPNGEFAKWFASENLTLDLFKQMIWHINNHTIDLYDCFKYRNLIKNSPEYASDDNLLSFKVENSKIISTQDVKKINVDLKYKTFVFLDKLLLQGSIKKVEKFITYHKLNLKTLITPYSELVIQKGTMAMNEAMLRYHDFTGDSNWKQIEHNLKLYCENDVRAMIMVYEFVMELVRSVFPEIDTYEYQMENENFYYNIENNKLIIKRINNE